MRCAAGCGVLLLLLLLGGVLGDEANFIILTATILPKHMGTVFVH
jgi:hypothetical protein